MRRYWVATATEYWHASGVEHSEAEQRAEQLASFYSDQAFVAVGLPDDPVVGAPLLVYDPVRRRLVAFYAG